MRTRETGSDASERQTASAGELCERAQQNERSEDNPDTILYKSPLMQRGFFYCMNKQDKNPRKGFGYHTLFLLQAMGDRIRQLFESIRSL